MATQPEQSPHAPNIVLADARTLTSGDLDLSELEQFGKLTVYNRCGPKLLQRMQDADIAITNKEAFDAATLSQLPRLRFISILATGTNVVDLAAAARQGIVVSNVPGYSTASVAQHVFALLLELENRTFEHGKFSSDGRWTASGDFSGRLGAFDEFAGKTLGIVGLGAIGRRVANIGAALGMRVVAAHQRSMNQVHVPHVPIEWLALDAVFQSADVVSLHCPLTESTRGLVSEQRLALMKPTALLINTARGPLVDERALGTALNEGRLRGAGLDVLSEEPPPADHPLLRTKNCLITPHMAWAATAARKRLLNATVANIQAFLNGSPINVV